jgi:hypothetical protein
VFALTRLVTSLTLLLFLSTFSLAQPAKPGTPAAPPKNDAPAFDVERLSIDEKDFPKSNETNFVQRLALSPEVDNVLKTDAEKATVEKVLKYYIYRLTWEEVQKERDSKATINLIMTDLIGHAETNPRLLPRPFSGAPTDQDMVNMRTRQLNNVQQMTPIFVKLCKDVLRSRHTIARINATRILAKLAEWGQESIIDELVNIINNAKESDAVKLWAFHGLTEIYSLQAYPNDPRAKGLFQTKEGQARLNKGLAATLAWLDAHTQVPQVKLQFMKPEEVSAIRYVRRAASKALGASRRPLIVDERQTNKQEGPIADVLCRIVGADQSVVPAPDLRERLDAAIALSQLRADNSPSYRPDYAAYQIANFLTAMGAEANANMNKKDFYVAWKWEAHRLKGAMEGFATQRTVGATTGYLGSFISQVRPLLEFFDDFTKNAGAVQALNNWLQNNEPPSKTVYKPLGEK